HPESTTVDLLPSAPRRLCLLRRHSSNIPPSRCHSTGSGDIGILLQLCLSFFNVNLRLAVSVFLRSSSTLFQYSSASWEQDPSLKGCPVWEWVAKAVLNFRLRKDGPNRSRLTWRNLQCSSYSYPHPAAPLAITYSIPLSSRQ